jgi:hypothetical protein
MPLKREKYAVTVVEQIQIRKIVRIINSILHSMMMSARQHREFVVE